MYAMLKKLTFPLIGAAVGAAYFLGSASVASRNQNCKVIHGEYQGYRTSLHEYSTGKRVVQVLKPKKGLITGIDFQGDGLFEIIEVLGAKSDDDLSRLANSTSLDKIIFSLRNKNN